MSIESNVASAVLRCETCFVVFSRGTLCVARSLAAVQACEAFLHALWNKPVFDALYRPVDVIQLKVGVAKRTDGHTATTVTRRGVMLSLFRPFRTAFDELPTLASLPCCHDTISFDLRSAFGYR
jgi:hypothetical protein